MKIGIIGGGSLGLMWTARLCLAGHTPLLIVRTEEQRELINREGLHYLDQGGHHVVHPEVESLNRFRSKLPPWVILAVKQKDIEGLLPFLQNHLSDDSYLFTLQNGLGHAERLERAAAKDRTILGVTTDGALRHRPNSIERTGYGESWFGTEGSRIPPLSIKRGLEELNQYGFKLTWDDEIMKRLWRKCIINSVINPLTAILQIRNGELLQSTHLFELMQKLFEEGRRVAAAAGFQFSLDILQEIEDICRNTSMNRSSMLQDLMAERETEIDYINGYLVRRGESLNIPMPTHQLLIQLIRAKEAINALRREQR